MKMEKNKVKLKAIVGSWVTFIEIFLRLFFLSSHSQGKIVITCCSYYICCCFIDTLDLNQSHRNLINFNAQPHVMSCSMLLFFSETKSTRKYTSGIHYFSCCKHFTSLKFITKHFLSPVLINHKQ